MSEKQPTGLMKNWQLIVFIAGGIFNAGILFGAISYMDTRLEKLEEKEEERQRQEVNYAVMEEKLRNIEKSVNGNTQTLDDIEGLIRDIATGN